MKKATVFVYLLILLMPLVGMLIKSKQYVNCEKRDLAELPDFSFSRDYIKGFEAYFKDNFGFRELMMHMSSKSKFKIFKSSGSTDHVIIGKDNWLYYTAKDDFIMRSFRKANPFSNDGINFMTKEWNKTKNQLAKKNIKYYMAVWPNKSTIYTENLPNRMVMQRKNQDSRLEQAIQHLEKVDSPFQIIDTREELTSARSDQPVYCKFDSHWNEYGAFIAYQKLMKEMGFIPYHKSDFDINWNETSTGDLIDALGICNKPGIAESLPSFTLKDTTIIIDNEDFEERQMRHFSNPNGDVQKSILVFRDSYTSALIPFLKLHFKDSYFIWKKFDQGLIDELKPDIVLDSKVERYFF